MRVGESRARSRVATVVQLYPFSLALSEATMPFHNGGYRVAKTDVDLV